MNRIKGENMNIGWLTGWKAIAEYCGYSADGLRRSWKKLKLPIYNIHGRRKALPKELDKWLSEQK